MYYLLEPVESVNWCFSDFYVRKIPTDEGIKIVKTPPKAPMCNAFAERLVSEAGETLNQIIPLGQRHFRHVVKCNEQHHFVDLPIGII
jgi:hypothetical protein